MFVTTILALSMVPLSYAEPTELWRAFDVKGTDPDLVPKKKFLPPPFRVPKFATTEEYPPKPDPEDMVQWYRYAAEEKPKMSMESSRSKLYEDSEDDVTQMPPIPQRPERRPKLDQEDENGNFNPDLWSWSSQQSFQDDWRQQGRESRPKKYKKTSDDEELSSKERFIPKEMEVKPMKNQDGRQQDMDQAQPMWNNSPDEKEPQNQQQPNSNEGRYEGGRSMPANEYVIKQMEMLLARRQQYPERLEGRRDDDWNNEDNSNNAVKKNWNEQKPRRDDTDYGRDRNFDEEPEINPYEYRSANSGNDNKSRSQKRHFGMPENVDSTNQAPKKFRKRN